MYNKIFISYASEDREYAEKLYNTLSENNFQPWMDKKKLLPGQEWDYQIKKALKEANFLILLLSSTSVGKRGYVQREFKLAADYAQEKLAADIYIIPVKIDKCGIPSGLEKFQWIEYSSADAMNKIIEAIEYQRTIMIQEDEKKKQD